MKIGKCSVCGKDDVLGIDDRCKDCRGNSKMINTIEGRDEAVDEVTNQIMDMLRDTFNFKGCSLGEDEDHQIYGFIHDRIRGYSFI